MYVLLFHEYFKEMTAIYQGLFSYFDVSGEKSNIARCEKMSFGVRRKPFKKSAKDDVEIAIRNSTVSAAEKPR